MDIPLIAEESAALLRELDHIIDDDRYFLSPRIRTLAAIRDKLRPPPVREPLPPLKHYEPPRAGARRRRYIRTPTIAPTRFLQSVSVRGHPFG
jgi:hypothetical protein